MAGYDLGQVRWEFEAFTDFSSWEVAEEKVVTMADLGMKPIDLEEVYRRMEAKFKKA